VTYASFIDHHDLLQAVLGIISYENDRILIDELGNAKITTLI
jgi:hypothetical protein